MMNKYSFVILSVLFFIIMIIYNHKLFYKYDDKNVSYITFITQRNRSEKNATLFTKIESFEDQVHAYKDILSNNKYDQILDKIITHCSLGTQQLGKNKYEEMINTTRITEKPQEQTLGARVLLTAEKFLKMESERYTLSSLDSDTYCIQKYANTL